MSSSVQQVTVHLLKWNGSTYVDMGTTTTGTDGKYQFTNVGPGQYKVSEDQPSGWTKTAETGATIVASSGVTSTGNNFANFKKIIICGTKYNDVNGTDTAGTIGTGDDVGMSSSVQQVTVHLLKWNGSTYVDIGTTTTGTDGKYQFTNVGPGQYKVSEDQPSGWTKTAETGATIVASSGVTSTGNNFANFKKIIICGTKYNDVNGTDTAGTIGTGDDVALSSSVQQVTVHLLK